MHNIFMYSSVRCKVTLLFILWAVFTTIYIVKWSNQSRQVATDAKKFGRELFNESRTADPPANPDPLFTKVRILCLVLTSPKNIMSRGRAVLSTWGRRCNKFFFLNDEPHRDFPTLNVTVTPGYNNLYNKTSTAFDYLWQHFLHYDWFLKCDDDTYVIMENLRLLLRDYSPEVPVYFGERFERGVGDKAEVYASGGAGYVYNRAALRAFHARKEFCAQGPMCPEDLMFGRHMQRAGVPLGESRDAENRTRFHAGDLSYYAHNDPRPVADWYKDTAVYFRERGLDKVSLHPISFHYLSPSMISTIEFLLYDIQHTTKKQYV